MLPVNTLEDLSLFTWDPWGFYEEEVETHPFPIEIAEEKGRYVVRAEVPGFRQRDLNITLEGNTLMIRGEHQEKREDRGSQSHRKEGDSRSLCRFVDLPGQVNSDSIKAILRNGVLEVRIPIEKRERPREIAVQAG